MRCSLLALAATATLAVTAPGAAAQSGCSVPKQSAWHSCLTAAHRAVKGTDQVRFTRATPVLIVRYTACPADLIRRKVTIRDNRGEKLATKRVDGRCKNGIARWKTTVRPNLDVRAGTIVRSYWSRLPDEDSAPGVRLGERVA
jgi:hypothetical protein